ncbi:MAG: polyribonucleotide nucleotidyltransferase [Clostridia bacterium]|nr:polyribonucleotide nucleotidyltransferase [Clostridia bacterium]
MAMSKIMDFKDHKVFETTLAGRPLIVETGKMAGLANGSCLIKYGETSILATATASAKPRDGIDFLPLSIDFDERLYAVGRIPGGYLRREGKPSEKAVLTSRVIDRPVRPLFPKDFRNDVAINLLTLSIDYDCSPEITAMIGASIALSISDIPWNGPIAGVFMGLVDGKPVVNPTQEQRKVSDLELTVAGSMEKVVMIEAGANEVPDDTMFEAIMIAHSEIKELCKFINGIVAEVGKPKFEYPSGELDHDMFDKIFAFCEKDVMFAMDTDDKTVRDARMVPIQDAIMEKFGEEYEGLDVMMPELVYKIQKKIVRRWLLEDKKRVDGRTMDEIRPLAAEVALLPRVHGSGMFTRGQTQVLTICTLGTLDDSQELDTIDEETSKRYMHHYNMPGFSTGEAKSTRSPGRREIGHGALAERSLVPVLPSVEEFPYAIRLVSEVISSNGSTSQASVCGSTLALMDAGVPITAPVAGISCGLITAEDGSWDTMIDIQGVEDFYGDMDFKVAGTHKGITSIQMDLKIDGLTPEIIRSAFEKTHKGRDYIIDEIILKAIPGPREEVSRYAPKLITLHIKTEKIREVIGKGGEVIQRITAESGAKIDIEDDGTIYIAAVDAEAGEKAKAMIDAICFEPEVGAVYTGKVTRIIPIGAFVEFAPGKEGMVHIKDLSNQFVEKVEDVVKEGDEITVKFLGIDDKGRFNLSRKVLLPKDGGDERPVRQAPKADETADSSEEKKEKRKNPFRRSPKKNYDR